MRHHLKILLVILLLCIAFGRAAENASQDTDLTDNLDIYTTFDENPSAAEESLSDVTIETVTTTEDNREDTIREDTIKDNTTIDDDDDVSPDITNQTDKKIDNNKDTVPYNDSEIDTDFYIDIDDINTTNETIIDNLEDIITQIPNATVNMTQENVSSDKGNDTNQVETPSPLPDTRTLHVSTDKHTYLIDEPVAITVDAPHGSDVNLIIENVNEQYAYFYGNSKYPVTYNFQLTKTLGDHIVKVILFENDKKEVQTTHFTIEPRPDEQVRLETSIDVPTDVHEGDMVTFKALVFGASGSVTYEWDFGDGVFREGSSREKYSFQDSGTYLTRLKVHNDEELAEDNAIIHVAPSDYRLIVEVRDSNAKIINDALVTLDEDTRRSDSYGKAEFSVKKGTYPLYVTKKGYLPVQKTETVNNTKFVSVILRKTLNITKNLQVIHNGPISRARLTDRDGKELIEVGSEYESLNLLLDIKKEGSLDYGTASVAGIKVGINNFNGLSAKWENTGDLKVREDENTAKQKIKDTDIHVKRSVTVDNVDSFLDKDSYYGSVTFDNQGIQYNMVLYCPDESSPCEQVEKCIGGFGELCYLIENDQTTVYIPHFSTIILALDNTTKKIDITSPPDYTESGEDIYLNLTINETVTARYKLDQGSYSSLGEGTGWSSRLSGYLEQGIISNGIHNITIQIEDSFGNTNETVHSFTVNDTRAPVISLVPAINNTKFASDILQKNITITSDESCKVLYKTNGTYSEAVTENETIYLTLDIMNNTNDLYINATDYHGNTHLYIYTFNVTYIKATCEDGIENGDETGIDCGGSCASCVPFNITTDQMYYEPGDQVDIRIDGRDYAQLRLKITGPSYSYNVTYNSTYPITYFLAPEEAGTYMINSTLQYMNNTEEIMTYFYINDTSEINPLSVSISANKTTVDEGTSVRFSASVSGYTGSLSYRWDFDGDGTTDSIVSPVTYTYNKFGNYNVSLLVSDQQNQKSASQLISVRRLFTIDFYATDKTKGSPLEDVTIDFYESMTNTSNTGHVTFTVPEGTREYTASKTGYYTSSGQVDADDNKTVSVVLSMKETDTKPPSITLISPDNNEIISKEEVQVSFKVHDESEVNCSLYLIAAGDSWWKKENTWINTMKDKTITYTLTNLENKTYQWNVECVDEKSNINISDTNTFLVDQSGSAEESAEDVKLDQSADDISQELDQALNTIRSLSSDEKEAAGYMKLDEKITDLKKDIERSKRDFDNIKFRKINDTEKDKLREEINDRIRNITEIAPANLRVIDKKEYVDYPEDNDIESVSGLYLDVRYKTLNSKYKKTFVETCKEIQKYVTVTTKIMNIELEYTSKKKEKVMLVHKIIKINDDRAKEMDMLEFIPKELANSTDYIEFISDHEVIKKDPLLSFDMRTNQEITYYIKGNIETAKTEDIRSILIGSVDEAKKNTKLTGFAVLKENVFFTQNKGRIIAEIIAIIILAIIYVSYAADDLTRGIGNFFFISKEMREIQSNIEIGNTLILKGDYPKAKELYTETKELYKKVPSKKRKVLYPAILNLHYNLDTLYINRLIQESLDMLKDKRRNRAEELYKKITTLYKSVPKSHKGKVAKGCIELHKEIKKR